VWQGHEIVDLAEGRVASLHEIAKQEEKVERHIRLLTPLAFVSPAKAIADARRARGAVAGKVRHLSRI
jgi:hypothetical protein